MNARPCLWLLLLGLATSWAGPPAAAAEAELIGHVSSGFGSIRVRRQNTLQTLAVTAEFMPLTQPPAPFAVWLQSALDEEELFRIGTMTIESSSRGLWKLVVTGQMGDLPALGVTDLREVSGRILEVRAADGLTVYLRGAVPLCPVNVASGGTLACGRLDFQRPDMAGTACGNLELLRQGLCQTLTITTYQMHGTSGWTDAVFGVALETGVATGEFIPIGTLSFVMKATDYYSLRTYWQLAHQGLSNAPTALAVGDLGALAGRRMEIRDEAGNLVLHTIVPELPAGVRPASIRGQADLLPPTGGAAPTGKIRTRFQAARGTSVFDVMTKGLPTGATFSLWIEDAAGSGQMTRIGPLDARGRFRRDTRAGQPLPLNVARVTDLTGRQLEIRDPQGAVLLHGTLP